MRFDILNPEQGSEEAIQNLANTLGEILVKAWDKDGKDTYGKPFNLNVVALIQTWLSGSLKVFVAYDNDKPVGFALGINFRPMQFTCNVLSIDTFYAETEEAERGLLAYISDAVRFLGVEEVWFTKPKDRVSLKLDGWEPKESLELCRLIKK